jgi:KDO2-lipid IV(A) lauroyltransferase
LGHDARTSDGAARLALTFDCPVVPVGIKRVEGPEFEITIYPPLDITPTGNRDADVIELTRHMNNWLEERIRENPAQWLWVHNRWPKPAKSNLLGSPVPPAAQA